MILKNKKNKYKNFILSSIYIGIIIITALLFTFKHGTKPSKKAVLELSSNLIPSAPITSSCDLYDRNDIHLQHAQINGLNPYFENDSDFNARIGLLIRYSKLIKVIDSNQYKIKTLTFSKPYLTPEAVDMLNEIGSRFKEKLAKNNHKRYCFMITSLIRTRQTQNKLCRQNRNATKSQTAHLFGTTVDISYRDFYNTENNSVESSYEAVQTLTKVLIEMRQECKILVVRERRQSCYHITVVSYRQMAKKQ